MNDRCPKQKKNYENTLTLHGPNYELWVWDVYKRFSQQLPACFSKPIKKPILHLPQIKHFGYVSLHNN